jgi:hypothetical protein
MQNWSGINEIINLFSENWDPDYWLVIHSHHKINDEDEIGKKNEKAFELEHSGIISQ